MMNKQRVFNFESTFAGDGVSMFRLDYVRPMCWRLMEMLPAAEGEWFYLFEGSLDALVYWAQQMRCGGRAAIPEQFGLLEGEDWQVTLRRLRPSCRLVARGASCVVDGDGCGGSACGGGDGQSLWVMAEPVGGCSVAMWMVAQDEYGGFEPMVVRLGLGSVSDVVDAVLGLGDVVTELHSGVIEQLFEGIGEELVAVHRALAG